MAIWIDIQNEEQFAHEVEHGPVMALFGSASNIAWRMMLGPIQAMANGLPPFIRVLYIDRDHLPELAQKRNVTIVPTAHFLHNGQKLGELNGANVTPENIHKSIDKLREHQGV